MNKTVNREYTILETYEAGFALTGAEVKAVRAGRMKLEGAYVKIIGMELFLVNADIAAYEFARPDNYDVRRTRKLLLHKKEIIRLKTKLDSGSNLTIVPIACYNTHSYLKLEIGLAKAKKTWEKKSVEKEKAEKRRVEKEIKEQMKY